jgi:hypothetical protein
MRTEHQILHHEVLVAFEARADRDLGLDDPVLMDGRFEVLSPPPRRLPSSDGGFGSLAFSIPLGGLIRGRPFKPFKRAISSRCSLTVRLISAISPSSRTTRAFSSPFDRPSMSPASAIPRMNQSTTDLHIAKSVNARSFAPLA